MLIASAVLEEMTKALQFADDSNGDIGGCIDSAIDVLYSVVKSDIADDLRIELFNYCLTAFSKELFSGWDWHYTMLDLACILVKDKSEAKQIHLLLDAIHPTGNSWDWNYKMARQLRAILIRKMEGEERMMHYMEQNIDNFEFRKVLIEKAISAMEYNKAITMAEEGIELNRKESPGYLNDWNDYLLQVYQLQNDKANILKYARIQFISANREKKPYFDVLKKHTDPNSWEASLAQIIRDLSGRNRLDSTELISRIFIWEEKWEDLLRMLRSDISLTKLEAYEKYLVNDYAGEVSDMYQTAILDYMKNNVSRSHYQQACRYIRRMIRMGAREQAGYVVRTLQKLYPLRRALMEELQKI